MTTPDTINEWQQPHGPGTASSLIQRGSIMTYRQRRLDQFLAISVHQQPVFGKDAVGRITVTALDGGHGVRRVDVARAEGVLLQILPDHVERPLAVHRLAGPQRVGSPITEMLCCPQSLGGKMSMNCWQASLMSQAPATVVFHREVGVFQRLKDDPRHLPDVLVPGGASCSSARGSPGSRRCVAAG